MLPAPYRWKETDGLAMLVAAEVAAENGDWNQATALFQSVDVKGRDNQKRERELGERIKRHKHFLLRIDAAVAASMDGRWMDVLKAYADLVSDGYVLTSEDRRRIDAADQNARGNLKMRRDVAGRSGSDMAVRKVDSEISQLDELVKAISAAEEQRKEQKR
jgi:hypothetical protein